MPWNRAVWWLAVPLSLASGASLAVALDPTSSADGAGNAVATRSAAQAGFTLTPEQLQINQRIAQAGVRRANLANRRLDQLGPTLSVSGATAGPSGAPGAAGAAGPAGEPGAPGAAGPGAARIAYDVAAAATPDPQTVLSIDGLVLTATCTASGPSTDLAISATSTEAATLADSFVVDGGTDPTVPGQAFVGNIQFSLPAGTTTTLGGPSAPPGQFQRSIAKVIYWSASRTITLDAAAMVDGSTARCSLQGTALPA